MARIPESEIDRLKSDISLVRLIEAQGRELVKQGKDLALRCPFHEDDTASLIVTPQKNLWHCFGCDAGGTVIDWVMRTEGVSFRHAVELLKERYACGGAGGPPACSRQTGDPSSAPVKRTTTRKLDAPLSRDADDQSLLNQVVDYYHQRLKEHPDAQAYLEQRGLVHPDLIDTFTLGVADRTLAYRLPQKNRKAGAELRGRLQALGLLRASGHEHFNGSLVIPIRDSNGDVVELYGRKLRDDLRKGTAYHLYLPGPHAGVFNAAGLASAPEAILCESLIDALTFWCAGYTNVTASYGTNGFADEHLAAFRAAGTERVLIAYDTDDAGNMAAESLAERLLAAGLDCYRLRFPKGMDANEYALGVQPASQSLGVVIRSAEWLGNGQPPPITTAAAVPVPAAGNRGASPPAADLPVADLPAAGPADLPSLAADEPPVEEEPPEPEEPLSPLPARRVADPPPAGPEPEINNTDVRLTFGPRTYRVRGLERNPNLAVLKVNLLVTGPGLKGEVAHVDTLDLYQSRPRQTFIRQAALELGLEESAIKADVGQLLLALEAMQEERLRESETESETVSMDEAELAAAQRLLKAPDLLERIVSDIGTGGLVGEDENVLVGYLAAVSRKLDRPLAVIVQSTSAAGKSALMEAVLALMPEEDRVQYSAMTGQSLYYMSEQDLAHKILAIVEEEGAERAAYALKLLQSEGELTIASTAKDPQTGQLVTQEYRVEGPVMIFLTTTAIDIDEELLNRCLVLTVNEERDQTRAIHAAQRKRRTLDGLLGKAEGDALRALHRNAQRLLRPLAVVNPYAERLTFVDHQTRTRRDHEKYLTLIDAIALLHQYQRPVKTVSHGERTLEYVEATLDDIAAANRLAHAVLGRTLDELPPQTRRLLDRIDAMVTEACGRQGIQRSDYRFTRRDVRDYTGWGHTQLKVHLGRLEELEYLLVHRGGRGQSFVYELLHEGSDTDGRSDGPRLPGLIDVEALQKCEYDGNRSGAGRGQVGGMSGGGRTGQNGRKPHSDAACSDTGSVDPKNAVPGRESAAPQATASY